MPGLSGKTALVTGSARRIGSAIATHLAHEGVNVVIHYHESKEEARKLHNEIVKLGVKSWLFSCDLADPEECKTLIDEAIASAGELDILVNNASVFSAKNFHDFDVEDVNAEMRTNAWAPLILSRHFSEKTEKGQIVNILDTRIVGYDFNHFTYYLSKRMLETLTESLALKLAPRIRVNGVAPGLVLAPEGKDKSYLNRLKDEVPLRKHGSPSDVVNAVIFLLKSEFITGQVIYVDGGKHLVQTIEGL